MAHGNAREGKWRWNWRMQWVVSTLHTTSKHGVSSITTADAHISAASSRLNWRPPADLNGLVRFAKRRNLVSARVPSHFNWPLPTIREEITRFNVTYSYKTTNVDIWRMRKPRTGLCRNATGNEWTSVDTYINVCRSSCNGCHFCTILTKLECCQLILAGIPMHTLMCHGLSWT